MNQVVEENMDKVPSSPSAINTPIDELTNVDKVDTPHNSLATNKQDDSIKVFNREELIYVRSRAW